ncbi:endonuclease/exonuclease/phosphatase family protein [Parapedobacter tibetensis]|uniref:endonuclease/exonuclease/phosphatase family protein n=1 Tax=Parapedobacter tibetensis TaxID=2972951 RepID=UPI00214D643F|nr:endonuclease/exonuclease/phosphatase family protein [Parapedobacter tibetensis]
MRNFLFIFIFFFSGAAVAQTAPPVRLKVLCYNLRFGELASLEELAGFIKAQDPDVVALQEVDCRTYRGRTPEQHGKDFITELGFRTGMLTAFGKTIPYAGGYYGIGILSKYPLASVERIYLPKTADGKEQRAVLVADIEYREGRYFTFASTHLDYVNNQVRQAQVEKLNEVLTSRAHPVILCGDFNARPHYEEIAHGMASWRPLDNTEFTVPANNPLYKIDYIFGYPKERWKSIEAVTYPVQLSDHLPLGALVELHE